MSTARGPNPDDQLVIGLICTPIALLLGWVLLRLLIGGFSATLDWFSHLVLVIGTEIVAALFGIFAFASLWSITGVKQFDARVFRSLAKFVLVTAGLVAVVVTVAALL